MRFWMSSDPLSIGTYGLWVAFSFDVFVYLQLENGVIHYTDPTLQGVDWDGNKRPFNGGSGAVPDSQPKTMTLIGTGKGSKRTKRSLSSVSRSTDKWLLSDKCLYNKQEPINYPCGVETQTRKHVVSDCHMDALDQHIADESAPDCDLANLLGITKGKQTLANFVRKSKASQE